MSWDTASCFKSMNVAYNDFQRQRNDQTIEDLQRQIDVILGVTSHGGATLNEFSPNELTYAETLSALVSLVNEPNLKISLYLKSLLALSHLVNDNDTKLCLQKNFNLSSSLVGFITIHSGKTSNKQMVLQAIMLLEKMTYNTTCTANTIYLSDLLKYLVKSIYTTSSEFCIPSLAVLANLCRNNPNVREFIQKIPDSKQFLKVLLSYLSNSNKTLSITSLSIMASLYLHESLGDNMFHGQNLVNMTKLAFRVLISNDDTLTCHYAIDLVIDFVRCEKTYKMICSSSTLEADILKIFSLLLSTDASTIIKVFDLLIEFCQHSSLCIRLSKVFFKNTKFDVETQQFDQQMFLPPQSLLHWISLNQNEDFIIQANILSIVFFRNMFNEFKKSGSLSTIEGYLNHILMVLLPQIEIDMVNTSKSLKNKFKKVAAIFDLVLSLIESIELRKNLLKEINFDAIGSMIDHTLNKFSDDLKFSRNSTNCWLEIADFIFKGLHVMNGLKDDYNTGLVKYLTMMKSQKLIPFLCYGLMSESKYQIKASLQIIGEALKVNHLDTEILTDTIYLHNSSQPCYKKSISNENCDEASPQIFVTQDLSKTVNKNMTSDNSTIIKLTEKLKDLDTNNNGIKASEIMEFYEHKLSALMGRESHILELLDAKSSTLVKTERLLAQFRCRHTQADAECLKFRTMLQVSEKKCEENLIKINNFTENKHMMDEKILSLQKKLDALQLIANEHERFKIELEEKNLELDSLQKDLKTVQDEKHSLQSTNASIIKDKELLDKKLESATKSISELEAEKHCHINLIQEKEKAEKGLKKVLKETNDKASSLETNVKELEASIGEKENTISQLHVELEKQCQISAMIHNLTMGKMNVPNLSANTSK